jgi:hypothetical protein
MTKPSNPVLDKVFGGAALTSMEQVSKWREPKTPPAVERRPWDRNPVMRGRKDRPGTFEFFTIGALAEALNRNPVTIRSWEQKRWFPPASYREEAPPTANLAGRVAKGRRLYSREQIEAAIAAAKVAKVYDPADSRTGNWSEFTRLVWSVWKSL